MSKEKLDRLIRQLRTDHEVRILKNEEEKQSLDYHEKLISDVENCLEINYE